MLIDVSYFMSGPRHIENVSVAEMPSPQSLAVNEVINGYIKAFQPEFLRNVVGVTLSQAITDYLELIEREKEDSSDEVDIPEEKEAPDIKARSSASWGLRGRGQALFHRQESFPNFPYLQTERGCRRSGKRQ